MGSASEKRQVVLCMHHDDADGQCSAAIVRKALGAQVILREMKYDVVPIPWDDITAADKLVIVDFSFSLEHMQRMMNEAEVIWIDHHKTSIERLADLNNLAGIRDLNEAACVLTWKYFFPNRAVPIAVRYIGDRDTWQFAYEQTAAFCEGLYQENTQPSNDALWTPLLDGDDGMVHRLIETGEILYKARMNQIKHRVEQDAFEVQFEGHRALVINSRGSGELGHAICHAGYEIAYCYIDGFRNGRLFTKVTLFSEKIDVAEIASRFGGGGHPGAAGFTFHRTGGPFPEGSHAGFS